MFIVLLTQIRPASNGREIIKKYEHKSAKYEKCRFWNACQETFLKQMTIFNF